MQPSMTPPAMTTQQAKFTNTNKSRLALYKEFAVGDESNYATLVYYELCMLLSCNLPGLPGFALRSILFPRLFDHCEPKVAFGRGLIIRNSKKISINKNSLIDDYVTLDARGPQAKINIGEHTSIGRFSIIAAKNGNINLGKACNIGTNCRIATTSNIHIGDSVLIAAYSYIGPGNHQAGDQERPLIEKEMENKGGVVIGEHSWIGARATILDGVKIGKRAIIGAHSLVREDVPDDCIAVGTPARVIKK
jgi:serine acetyltransferase